MPNANCPTEHMTFIWWTNCYTCICPIHFASFLTSHAREISTFCDHTNMIDLFKLPVKSGYFDDAFVYSRTPLILLDKVMLCFATLYTLRAKLYTMIEKVTLLMIPWKRHIFCHYINIFSISWDRRYPHFCGLWVKCYIWCLADENYSDYDTKPMMMVTPLHNKSRKKLFMKLEYGVLGCIDQLEITFMTNPLK